MLSHKKHITLQALALWKLARRDEALTTKAALLANAVCNPLPTQVSVVCNNFGLEASF